VKSFQLALSQATPHLAGQYYVVRLTAPDGYTAQRSYSVATPPGDGISIELAVERLDDGEVSTFLHDEVQVGDTLEVRGPIGGWFAWDGTSPALLIGGGSGIAPLMAMLRLARREAAAAPVHLIASVRSLEDLIYASELEGADTTMIFTRTVPEGFVRSAGRITSEDVRPHLRDDGIVFICGSAGFADGATERTLEAGADASSIRVERFGPTS